MMVDNQPHLEDGDVVVEPPPEPVGVPCDRGASAKRLAMVVKEARLRGGGLARIRGS